jgi:hypothetical protein
LDFQHNDALAIIEVSSSSDGLSLAYQGVSNDAKGRAASERMPAINLFASSPIIWFHKDRDKPDHCSDRPVVLVRRRIGLS